MQERIVDKDDLFLVGGDRAFWQTERKVGAGKSLFRNNTASRCSDGLLLFRVFWSFYVLGLDGKVCFQTECSVLSCIVLLSLFNFNFFVIVLHTNCDCYTWYTWHWNKVWDTLLQKKNKKNTEVQTNAFGRVSFNKKGSMPKRKELPIRREVIFYRKLGKPVLTTRWIRNGQFYFISTHPFIPYYSFGFDLLC